MRDVFKAVPTEEIEREATKALAKAKQDAEVEEGLGEDQDSDRSPGIHITTLHLMDIGRLPLLTHQEEIALAKQIEMGRQAHDQLCTATDLADRLLLEKEISEGIDAKNILWESNCRLVVSIARKYIRKGVPFDDLIQEGNLGLEHAIIKFDWRRGFRFATYAYWWIRQSMLRAIANQARTIRVPVHAIEFMTHVFKSAEVLRQQHGTYPDTKQIADYIKVPVEVVIETLRAHQTPVSLEIISGKYENKVIADFIPGSDNVAERCEQTALAYEVREGLLNKLNSRERTIIDLRYGLSDGNRRTLSEIGLVLGVTRERVRQIEAETLRKLRTSVIRERFIDYLE